MRSKQRIRFALAITAVGVVFGGCSALNNFDGLSGGSADGGAAHDDASTSSDGSQSDATADVANNPDGASTDGSANATDGGADGAPSCGGRPGVGATMLRVYDAGYCIDTTEVTYDQYAVFYGANPTPTSPDCAWKTSYTPPPQTGTEAIGNVDWCDANEFCAWAGKRLCGGVNGAVMNLSNSLTVVDEWQLACTHYGDPNFVWPYGNGSGPDPSVCLYADSPDSGHSRAVASNPSCVGPAGVFDMSGNVWEWENACDRADAAPAGLQCNLRGGGFLRVSSNWGSCLAVPGGWDRNSRTDDTGIRCCSDWR
jgi:formylglycine-generating enzyme required for sulfatase activity